MPMPDPVPTLVLGGTGYVSGELLRLLVMHPVLRVAGVVSTSQAGAPVLDAFPHLAGNGLEGLPFETLDGALSRLRAGERVAVFAATPHGATATLLDRLLDAAAAVGARPSVVDLSADFRFKDPARWQEIYGKPHAAPQRCAAFTSAVPEQLPAGPPPTPHAAQPGCFVTAAVLAAHPAFALGLVEDDVFVAAITGSSGSGRTPAANTHHPERRSNLYAYSPLVHRHEAEMRTLLGLARGGAEPEVAFVPHSGPFARGIHATLRMTLREPADAATIAARYAEVYAGSPFVGVGTTPPKLVEVVGTNRCRIGIAVRGRLLVATSVIDNMVKGSAGGGVQWMNRLLGLPDETGLRLPGLGYF